MTMAITIYELLFFIGSIAIMAAFVLVVLCISAVVYDKIRKCKWFQTTRKG